MAYTRDYIQHMPDMEGPQAGAVCRQIEPMRIRCAGGYSPFSVPILLHLHLWSLLSKSFKIFIFITAERETHYIAQTGLELTM
jgi:hypothetical protein